MALGESTAGDLHTRDARVGAVLNDFIDRRARGEAVSEGALLAEHADIADELREHLSLLTDLTPGDGRIESLLRQGVLTRSDDERYLAEFGAYRITGLLGCGGMGIVLKAHEESLNRTVALKLLRPELADDSAAVRRFDREAKAAGSLRHPNIVTVYAVGEQRGTPFIAMEYVAGGTLADMIREHGPLPNDWAREIFRQMLLGLQAAHEAGLIHRDVKPSNVLVEEELGDQAIDGGHEGEGARGGRSNNARRHEGTKDAETAPAGQALDPLIPSRPRSLPWWP